MQSEMNFETGSPINVEKLSKQNKLVYLHLEAGNTIHMLEAVRMGIFHLHSRMSDLRNKHNIQIHDRFITVTDKEGWKVSVKEYSLTPFN